MIKKINFLVPLLMLSCLVIAFGQEKTENPAVSALLHSRPPDSTLAVRYNQVSYLMGRPKLLNIVSESDFNGLDYVFRKEEGDKVLSGTTSKTAFWPLSSEYVATVDFSQIDEPGTYIFSVADQSIAIKIKEGGLADVAKATLKYYYYNRASTTITEALGGDFNRPMGHPDNKVKIHTSAATDKRPEGNVISAPKGWYDAGDYNKYVVNSGISTYTLLASYEHYPEYYDTLGLEIPEAGDALPDILDEVIWNLDWMLDMQDPNDGGVYHKLTGLQFSGTVMPAAYDLDRYVVAKSTAAALDFAAVMATASRIFSAFETEKPGYSTILLEAAEKAYAWAEKNPEVYFTNPEDVSTGGYGDRDVSDEFQWAATELLITTQNENYRDRIDIASIKSGVPSWSDVGMLAIISLDFHSNLLEEKAQKAVIKKLTGIASSFNSSVTNSPMHVAMGSTKANFNWGSNGGAGNQLLLLIRAYEATKDKTYLQAAYKGMDYLLGRNATGYCFITGFGERSPMHPHHRISEADAVVAPVPGMVVGGPNPGQQDGCAYPSDFPAKSYADSHCSYASNEVTINWNAPVAYVLNALNYYEKQQNDLKK